MVNSISDTNVKKSIRQDVRTAFQETLEKSVPANQNLVRGAMTELQKLIEARNYSAEVLNGFKIRGGKLTDIVRNAVATNVGQIAGGGVGGAVGGIPGAAMGWVASEKIGNWLAKNTLSNAADRRALAKLKVEQPTIWKDIQKYIDELNDVDANKVKQNLMLVDKKTFSEDVKTSVKKKLNSTPSWRDLPNQQGGFISTGATTDLIKEAKKYKSAEEFVKAQGEPLYHGTNAKFDILSSEFSKNGWLGKGIYLTPEKKIAKKYGKVLDVYMGNLNLYEVKSEDWMSALSELNKVYPEIDVSQHTNVVDVLKKKGFDGIKMKSWDDDIGTIVNVFDSNKLKTKSQLEQIWREAQKTSGSTRISPLNAIAGATAVGVGANAYMRRNKK
jgi:hypothetical protein